MWAAGGDDGVTQHGGRLPRVVATDLDGTLLRSDGSLSDRTRVALCAVEAAGIEVVIVTARPPRWVDPLADAVGGHGTVLCSNGAFVYDVPARRVTDARTIPHPDLTQATRTLRAAVPEVVFAVERADGFGREPEWTELYRVPADHPVGSVEELAGPGVGKLLARAPNTAFAEFHRHGSRLVAPYGEVGFSGAVGLLEVTGRGVTKSASLARWCAAREVAAGEVWAFGDMPNDLPMLGWAGRAHAVHNAHPEVRSVADVVCASNDDDGVARCLEALVDAAERAE